MSGFDYENIERAATFTPRALEALCLHVKHNTLITTFIEKRGDAYYNVAKVIHNGRVIYEQAKTKLFALGDEHRYFNAGDEAYIHTFEIDGLKISILICFELRFKHLWQRCEGSDIIAVPARWGHLRAQNFTTLTKALAVMNQCYVIASDASNDDCSAQSGIITPFGEAMRNGVDSVLQMAFEPKQIAKMRRYLDVGIACE